MKGKFFINSKIAKNGCLNEGHWLKSSVDHNLWGFAFHIVSFQLIKFHAISPLI